MRRTVNGALGAGVLLDVQSHMCCRTAVVQSVIWGVGSDDARGLLAVCWVPVPSIMPMGLLFVPLAYMAPQLS